MRTTKAEVQGMFKRLVRAIGKDVVGESYNTPTDDLIRTTEGLYLDYNAVYGGYVIEEYNQSGGKDNGIHHPFGSNRRSAREMYLSMLMAAQALENENHKAWQQRHSNFLAGGAI